MKKKEDNFLARLRKLGLFHFAGPPTFLQSRINRYNRERMVEAVQRQVSHMRNSGMLEHEVDVEYGDKRCFMLTVKRSDQFVTDDKFRCLLRNWVTDELKVVGIFGPKDKHSFTVSYKLK